MAVAVMAGDEVPKSGGLLGIPPPLLMFLLVGLLRAPQRQPLALAHLRMFQVASLGCIGTRFLIPRATVGPVPT